MNSSESSKTADHDDVLMEEQPDRYSDYEATIQVSMETHIPETNVGYKLLQKMGWKVGRGLGLQGQGRVDPIRIELKDDSLGVGKAEEYSSTHISTTAKRKALDSEKQLEETETQRIEREHQVEKKQAIAEELKQVKKAFYCELCDKQYTKISEYDQHLQSYDHHHKKRFKDMRESTRHSTMNQSEREKKLARERKREEKELKRMQEALQKKMGKSGADIPKPSIPVPVAASASTTNSSSGGGWTSTETIIPASSNQSNRGGWTAPISSAQPLNVVPTKSDTVSPKLSLANSPQPAAQSKKLSFGLKKTTGFQFGLKKK